MNSFTVACPLCGLSWELSARRVPDSSGEVTCPRCRCSFRLARPAGALSISAAQPAPEVRRPRLHRPVRHWELNSLSGLVREGWEVFRCRFAILVGLCVLSLAAFSVPVATAVAITIFLGLEHGEVLTSAVWTAGVVVSHCLGFGCFSGFLCAVALEGLGFEAALERGRGVTAGVLWIAFLSGFIIVGGFMLLLLPGIVFAVWFSFAQFVLIREDYRGMDALLKSKEYVRGQWGKVALRLMLVWFALLLLAAVPVAGPFLAVLFFPYLAIVHYLIYRDLREMKGEVPFPSP